MKNKVYTKPLAEVITIDAVDIITESWMGDTELGHNIKVGVSADGDLSLVKILESGASIDLN